MTRASVCVSVAKAVRQTQLALAGMMCLMAPAWAAGNGTAKPADVSEQARAIARQEAIIERQLRDYAQRPRKQFIGQRTTETRFAEYVKAWQTKIESVGTRNFRQSDGKPRYGSLVISVDVSHDGSVKSSVIQRSSGDTVLDQHALDIVQWAAPFPPFPADIRKDTDVLVITRTWTFLNDKGNASPAAPQETP